MDGFVAGIIFGTIMVSAVCFLTVDSDIYPSSFKYAEDVCGVNGGVDYLSEGLTRFSTTVCKNGAVFKFDNDEVRKEE